MDKRLEALAGFVLDGIVRKNLSDASVYEFTEQSCICIHRGAEVRWENNLEKLWDYFSDGCLEDGDAEEGAYEFFRQGRVYGAMELLRMLQQQKKDEETLHDDAKRYGEHWRPVFETLAAGSMTHGTLAQVCGISDSSLTQFLHRIEGENYIQFRKAGRTKYYRLTGRGKCLLECMPPKKSSLFFPLAYKNTENFETQVASGMSQGKLVQGCGISDLLMTHFWHSDEGENDIPIRKAGRAKRLLDSMPPKMNSVFPLPVYKRPDKKDYYKISSVTVPAVREYRGNGCAMAEDIGKRELQKKFDAIGIEGSLTKIGGWKGKASVGVTG